MQLTPSRFTARISCRVQGNPTASCNFTEQPHHLAEHQAGSTYDEHPDDGAAGDHAGNDFAPADIFAIGLVIPGLLCGAGIGRRRKRIAGF